MRQRIKGKFKKKKLNTINNAYKELLHLYNIVKLNYVVELKLGEKYLYEKGDNLAEILEDYLIDEGYDIIVECYTQDKNAYLIIDCEDETENMWDMVSLIYMLLIKFNIDHEIIW